MSNATPISDSQMGTKFVYQNRPTSSAKLRPSDTQKNSRDRLLSGNRAHKSAKLSPTKAPAKRF